ncbi:bile acid:sodium symporter family protein [Planctomicrobium sp. SH664]|uniref:bile acid:sodium symporter family protein n=1 Tax=Planctomicrobium sp. SH664 TaxID=3448125 RepID=UPI003F5B133E
MSTAWNFAQRRWFLISLLVLLPLGTVIGWRAEPDRVSSFPRHIVEAATGVLTATVLLLMSMTLERTKLVESLRAPFPVLGAILINFVLIPAAALPLLPLQQREDLMVGLMLAAAVPSTLAAAAVWTRKAGGNDAIALLVSVLTNSACFVVTPLWLKYGCGGEIQLNTTAMMLKLFYTALLPIVVGQLCRLWPPTLRFADRGKESFGVVAQVLLLAVLFWAAVQGGVKLNLQRVSPGTGGSILLPFVISCGSVIILHLLGLGLAFPLGKLAGIRRADLIGMAFSGSQKTLPIGLFIATGLLERGLDLAAIPILIYHATQLVLDGFLLEPLKRWSGDDLAGSGTLKPLPVASEGELPVR